MVMDTKVACLLLIILGALTVQGAVSGNKRMKSLHARQWGDYERECMNNNEEMCFPRDMNCPQDYYDCYDYDCGSDYSRCCCRGGW